MTLTAVTLLGENTIPILDGLCRYVTAATGIELRAGARRPVSSADAAEWAGDADLVWGCGYLLCGLLDGGGLDAAIVAAPVFSGQTEPVYHSVIVAADPSTGSIGDARGSVLAVNEAVSWSGHHALVAHLADLGTDLTMFGRMVETGSHRASVEALVGGTADVAAIDHTIWAELSSQAQFAALRVVDRTRDWPAPPFAVHRRLPAEDRARLVAELVAVPPDAVAGLSAVAPAVRSDYDVMTRPPESA